MRRLVIGLLSGSVLGTASLVAQAGTYLQSEGDLNYSTSVGVLTATEEWNDVREREDIGCRSIYGFLSQYFDYGYSYYHSLYGGVNLAHLRCKPSASDRAANPAATTESKTGFGDVTVGIRGRIDPTRNDRAWELELNIPTSRETTGSSRLGCGAYAVTGNVGTREEIFNRALRVGAEAGIQLWESPLVHQFEAKLRANGAVVARRTGWKWGADLSGYTPLDRSRATVDPGISDCGTTGSQVRGDLSLGYVPSPNNYISCTVEAALWGRETTRRQGFYCGFSHLFKR